MEKLTFEKSESEDLEHDKKFKHDKISGILRDLKSADRDMCEKLESLSYYTEDEILSDMVGSLEYFHRRISHEIDKFNYYYTNR